MSINSHPSSGLLARFASGDLPLALALVVESHAETCRHCAGSIRSHEEGHGRVLMDLPDAEMRPDALERALARLESPASTTSQVGDVPLPAAILRHGLLARRFLGPDYWVAPVRRSHRDNWRAYVIRAPEGTKIPVHRHVGPEYFQVLMGDVQGSVLHRAGDFVSEPPDLEHALEVSSQAPCACLIAGEKGAHWRGFTRLLSPWLGI